MARIVPSNGNFLPLFAGPWASKPAGGMNPNWGVQPELWFKDLFTGNVSQPVRLHTPDVSPTGPLPYVIVNAEGPSSRPFMLQDRLVSDSDRIIRARVAGIPHPTGVWTWEWDIIPPDVGVTIIDLFLGPAGTNLVGGPEDEWMAEIYFDMNGGDYVNVAMRTETGSFTEIDLDPWDNKSPFTMKITRFSGNNMQWSVSGGDFSSCREFTAVANSANMSMAMALTTDNVDTEVQIGGIDRAELKPLDTSNSCF